MDKMNEGEHDPTMEKAVLACLPLSIVQIVIVSDQIAIYGISGQTVSSHSIPTNYSLVNY